MATILLAEDDLRLRRIFAKWIESEGHDVVVADNGVEGLRAAIFESMPDILVTDVMMPECDGEELTVMFDTIAHGRPVVVVTACSDEAKLAAIAAEGNVRNILRKPVPRERLLGALRDALSDG